MATKRNRNAVIVHQVKIRWYKGRDGRTFIDPRRYKRRLVAFTDHAEALEEARRIALEIHNGGAEVLALTAAQRADFARAEQLAKQHGAAIVPAMTEWSDCQAKMNAAAAMLRGADMRAIFTAGIATMTRPIFTVPSQVAEFLRTKGVSTMSGEKSKCHYHGRLERDLRNLLPRFAADFPGDIAAVEPGQIEKWLDDRKRRDGSDIGPKRRNFTLALLRELFKFARDRKRLPDVKTAPQMVDLANIPKKPVDYLTPREMTVALAHTDDLWLPWPVCVGFNAVRTEEVALGKDSAPNKDCLRWEDFEWDAIDKEAGIYGEICIRSEVAKTGVARRIPIHRSTWLWLKPWRDAEATGPVVPGGDKRGKIDKYREKFLKHLRKQAETGDHKDFTPKLLKWPGNVYRHSYGSYRMATLKNAEIVSNEMGDSPAMIKSHYDNPRPKRQAAEWFAIIPEEHASQLILFPNAKRQ